MFSIEVERELSVFCKTTDDWCGSFPLKDFKKNWLVNVGLTMTDEEGEKVYIVYACGDDDLDKIKRYSSYSEALDEFCYICSVDDVTISSLVEIGFE